MSKRFFALAFAVGLATVLWVGLGFMASNWIALALTLVIAATYLLGAYELAQFRTATTALDRALDAIPPALPSLSDWLDQVPAGLRNAVRLRIEGERGALPGPALTPYLVGLLVMLGMLGTFLGMVVTFKGAVFAMEGSTDLQAMRSALAEPIKGLGLSFGTSVAGVAASAMLGLMSAIARRERMEAARLLETRIATALQPFSLVHQRQETFKALQQQARVVPEVVDRLEAMMARIEQRSRQLDEQLLERQARLQQEVTLAFTALAGSVGTSLKDSLAAGARAAGENITPVIESAMARIVQDTERMHARLDAVARGQVDALSQQFSATTRTAAETWTSALQDMGNGLQQEWQRVGSEAIAQQQAVCVALDKTTAEIAERSSRLAERDNAALQDRNALLEQLGTLLHAVNQASGEQGKAVEAMVRSATSVLEEAGAQFAQALQTHGSQAADMATHANASAIELASLGEAFGQGVQRFQASNDKLAEGLQRIEASLLRSTARSDEQLAYYVAQAREVIDLSIASQQGLVENLRQIQGRKPAAVPAEAIRA